MQDKERVHEALITFSDFIYAIVFVAIVQKVFDDVLNNTDVSLLEKWSKLLLLVAIFYFLTWDWILGRILTLRNPYKGYTTFFLELLIAGFAYGAASAAINGNVIFLLHFSCILFFGAMWARRVERHITEKKDLQELCMIQTLQFIGMLITLIFFIWWCLFVGLVINDKLIAIVVIGGWSFILVYEMMVPRYPGVLAGPGALFLQRSDVRTIRRFLKEKLV
jgi:hypothetical protein